MFPIIAAGAAVASALFGAAALSGADEESAASQVPTQTANLSPGDAAAREASISPAETINQFTV
jgi:hypothetical protein